MVFGDGVCDWGSCGVVVWLWLVVYGLGCSGGGV